jgi:hypothetical protein
MAEMRTMKPLISTSAAWFPGSLEPPAPPASAYNLRVILRKFLAISPKSLQHSGKNEL